MKEHHRCHLYFEDDDGDVQRGSEGTPLSLLIDRVPREEPWGFMRNSRGAETYVRPVQCELW